MPDNPPYHIGVFATVPPPGYPEGIAVSSTTVYVGTHRDWEVVPDEPSHVFSYDRNGQLIGDLVITGQESPGQGILAMALDEDENLYVLDRSPSRILRIDAQTQEQTVYAELPNPPNCSNGVPDGGCAASTNDLPPLPDELAFGPDGYLYVSDFRRALIYRVPPGGGGADIWFTSLELDSIFGPNGIRFMDDGQTILLALSGYQLKEESEIPNGQGRLYKIPVNPDGSPGELELYWQGDNGDVIDGFSIGESGNVYAALALPSALIVIDPTGKEVARIPGSPHANEQLDVPFNAPASVAFLDESVLVTNQAVFGGPPEHHVVLSVEVGEPERPLFYPKIPKPFICS